MKKIVILLLAVLCFSQNSFAQDGPFKFGIHLSPGFSWLNPTDDQTISRAGSNILFSMGVMGDYYFAENYAFAGGLNYTLNQGGKMTYNTFGTATFFPDSQLEVTNFNIDSLSSGTTITRQLHYVEIPVSLKMRTNELGNSMLRGWAQAPVFTIGFNSQARAEVNAPEGSAEKLNIGKDTDFMNISWGLGGGVEFYPNDQQTAITAGVFFQSGLVDVTNNIFKDGQDINPSERLTNIIVRLGVMF